MRITTGLALLTMLITTEVRGQEKNAPALLVLHKGDKTMAIVDPANGKVLGSVLTTARDPHELAVSADGTLAVASKKAVKTIDAGARALNRLKFAPDGSLALVSDIFGGVIIVIDVASQAVKASVNRIQWALKEILPKL